MPKNSEQETDLTGQDSDAVTDTDTETAPVVDIASYDAAIVAAQETLDTVMATSGDAVGDLTKMLAFADALKSAKIGLDRANANKASALYDLLATERLEFSTDLREQVADFIAPFEERARELSLTSVHVTFGAEGGIQVSVMDSSRPVAKRSVTRTPGAGPSADGKNRNLWTLPDGSQLASRDLLLQHGDKVSPGYGELAVKRATRWKEPIWGPNGNEPMKSGPGFNSELLKVAAAVGATR